MLLEAGLAVIQKMATKQQRNQVMKPAENADQLAQKPTLDEAEKLIWAYLDKHIEQEDVERLEHLLKENEHVRQRYAQCAEIHADLYTHYQQGAAKPVESKSPVLGSLLIEMPGTLSGSSPLVD